MVPWQTTRIIEVVSSNAASAATREQQAWDAGIASACAKVKWFVYVAIIIWEIALSSVVVMMVMISAAIVAADYNTRVKEPIHALWWLPEELIMAHEASSKGPTHANIRNVIGIA